MPDPDAAGRTLLLTLEYDGSHFAGWQVQPGQRTVQGEVEAALQTVCRHPVRVHCAGRTDAGVHAWGQTASFRTSSDVTAHRLLRGLNALCGDGVRVVAVQDKPVDFHARYASQGKVYAYRLLVREAPSALLQGRAWHLPADLDMGRLADELVSLPGTADWSAYRASDCGNKDPVKRLDRVELVSEPRDVFALVFEGSGFLKQMVRTLVGTAVEVARGRFEPGSMLRIREGLDRTKAGPTAPAHGLYLERVLY